MTEAANASTSTLYCDCGTLLSEVCLIPGTENCLACHELVVMEQTGVGVVLLDAGGAYLKEFPSDHPGDFHGAFVSTSFDDEEIPF